MAWRISLSVCGLLTVLVGRGFGFLAGLDPSASATWGRFRLVVVLIGVLAIGFSLIPSAWMRGIKSAGKQRTPLPLLVTFGVFGFAATLLFSLLPATMFPSKGLLYTVCPACVLTATVDPSFASVALILAPLDGAVFGAFGGLLGAILNIVRR